MRATHLLVAIALLVPSLAAQRAKLLPAAQVATGGKHAELARAADMTGDGVLDIVTTRNLHSEFETAGLVILRGLQGGSDAGRFVVHSFKSAPRQPWFAIADVNGDGLPDVVSSRPPGDASSSNPPAVQVFRDTPAGSLMDPLTSPISAVVGEHTGDLRLADFDEDGELDVAVITGLNIFGSVQTIRVGLGHGDGTFGAFAGAAPAKYALAAADVDGDGHVDLVSGDGPVTLPGHGDGTFGAGLPAAEPGTHWHVTVGDLDGIGALDFVGVGDSYSGVDVRAGQPDGAFGAPLDLLLGGGAFPYEVLVRDLDEDGHSDIVASLPYGDFVQAQIGSLVAWRGQGGLAFAPHEQLPVGSSPFSLDFADLDSDGLDDALLGQQTFTDPDSDPTSGAVPGVAILFRRAAPTPGQTLAQAYGGMTLNVLSDYARTLGGGDVDGDGHVDVLALLEHQHVASLLGDGAGGLAPAVVATIPGLQSLPIQTRRLHVADLDGDGADDLLLSGVGSVGQLAALSLGDGLHFAAPATFGGGDANDELLADANADGALDVVAARPLENQLDVHLGAGDGSFAVALPMPVADLPRVLAAADLDDDGLPDLAVATGGSPQIAVLLGAGGGAFHAPSWLAAPEAATALAFADLDEDGAPELLSLANGADLVVRAGLGGDAFAPAQSTPLEEHATQLSSGDLDHDGRLDVLALLPGRDAVAFLGGDGQGGLLPAVGFCAGFTPVATVLADLDEDGYPDLASGVRHDFPVDAVLVQLGPSGPFADLGYAKGGAASAPKLVGSGTPAAGQTVSLTTSGVGGALGGFLLAGFDSVHQSFKGGTLVPTPTLALAVPANVTLSGPWPSLAPGSAAYLQAWFATTGGVVATNALVVVTE